jgi:hypothetical protein
MLIPTKYYDVAIRIFYDHAVNADYSLPQCGPNWRSFIVFATLGTLCPKCGEAHPILDSIRKLFSFVKVTHVSTHTEQ